MKNFILKVAREFLSVFDLSSSFFVRGNPMIVIRDNEIIRDNEKESVIRLGSFVDISNNKVVGNCKISIKY